MIRLSCISQKWAAAAVLVVALLPLVSTGCSVDETRQAALGRFQEASRSYSEGRFDEALEIYLELFRGGFSSGPLLYNIGNCYYRQGEIGESILFYERARWLMPGDEDLAHNLELSQLRVTDTIVARPEFWLFRLWRGAVHLLSPAWLTVLLTVSWLGLVASLMILWLSDSPWTRWSAPAARIWLVVLLAAGACLGNQWWYRVGTTEAIVIAEKVRAFGSPGETGVEVFVLHEGVKVTLGQIRDGWYEIVLADGNHGWVPADGVEII